MKISASAWKNVDSQCHADKLLKDGLTSREWKREAAQRSQKTKVKTNKTNKGFK